MKKVPVALVIVVSALLVHGPLFAQAPSKAAERVQDKELLKSAAAKLQKSIESKSTLQKSVAAKAGALGMESVSPLTSLQATVSGTFWRNAKWAKTLNLSVEQQRQMDDVFQQHRLRLVDLTAALRKEELTLDPLFATVPPTAETSAGIFAQIDRIAEARAELEKANSRMLIGILQVLTPEQFKRLPIPVQKARPISAPLNLK